MKIVKELEVYPENAPTDMSWADAEAYCASLGEGWRLPTKEELNEMFEHKDELGGFGGGWFWSSSQYSGNYGYAWFQNFSCGYQGSYSTYYNYSVRACRAFTHLSIDSLSEGGE